MLLCTSWIFEFFIKEQLFMMTQPGEFYAHQSHRCSLWVTEHFFYGDNERDQNKHVLCKLMWVLTWFWHTCCCVCHQQKRWHAILFLNTRTSFHINEPHLYTSGKIHLQQCWLLIFYNISYTSYIEHICCCLGLMLEHLIKNKTLPWSMTLMISGIMQKPQRKTR